MNNQPAFHRWLKQARIERDLARTELAERVGCSLAMIRQLEYGRRRPSRELAASLAHYLQIPPEDREAFIRAARQPIAPADPATSDPAASALAASDPSPEPYPGRDQPRLAIAPPIKPLIGREQTLAAARALLVAPTTRLLTLIGPGGVGKTLLGLHLASQAQGLFADGAVFIPLDTLHDASLLPVAIAQALDLADAKREPSLERLIGAIGERALLLVLDNFEHLLAAAPLLGAMLGQCPRLKLLVTSRSATRLQVEQLFVVPPLPVPDPAILADPDPARLGAIAGYAAIELFVSRARMVQADFALTAENAAAVGAICQQLNGLPLALELAAARVRGLPPAALLARLSDRLGLLTGGSDRPERHQTLRNLIEWSYNLLSPAEQGLFRRLAAFVGRWTLEAAEVVCAGAGEPPGAVMDGALALLDKSLLREDHRPDGSPAFGMLHMIRDYALERLRDSGEEDALHQRHAGYYLDLARAAEEQITGAQQTVWLERLEWERDNIRGALGWLISRQQAEPALHLIGHLWKFWQIRTYWSEGLRWVEAALTLPSARTPAYLLARIKVLWGAGWLALDMHNIALATDLFTESLARARSLNDQRGVARALHGVGILAQWQGYHAEAMAAYEESLVLFRECVDTEEIAWSLRHLSSVLQSQGRYAESLAQAEEALALFRSIGHQRGVMYLTMMLAQMYIEQGAYPAAAALLEECLEIARRHGYDHGVIEILRLLGGAAQKQGRFAEAARYFAESLALARSIKDESGIRWGLIHQGWLALLQGDPDTAHAALSGMAPEFERYEPPWAMAWLEARLGRIALERDDRPRAARHYVACLLLCQRNDFRWGFAECLEGLAALAEARPGGAVRAAALFGAAEVLRAELAQARATHEQDLYAATLDRLSRDLDPAALETARQHGAALPLDAAIALAVG